MWLPDTATQLFQMWHPGLAASPRKPHTRCTVHLLSHTPSWLPSSPTTRGAGGCWVLCAACSSLPHGNLTEESLSRVRCLLWSRNPIFSFRPRWGNGSPLLQGSVRLSILCCFPDILCSFPEYVSLYLPRSVGGGPSWKGKEERKGKQKRKSGLFYLRSSSSSHMQMAVGFDALCPLTL